MLLDKFMVNVTNSFVCQIRLVYHVLLSRQQVCLPNRLDTQPYSSWSKWRTSQISDRPNSTQARKQRGSWEPNCWCGKLPAGCEMIDRLRGSPVSESPASPPSRGNCFRPRAHLSAALWGVFQAVLLITSNNCWVWNAHYRGLQSSRPSQPGALAPLLFVTMSSFPRENRQV